MKTHTPRIILGVAIVAAGAMLLLDRLGVPGLANTLGTWWPMFVVAAGIASLISNPRYFLWPTAIIAFGVLLQFDRLDMIDFNPWQMIWPVDAPASRRRSAGSWLRPSRGSRRGHRRVAVA